MPHPDTSFPWSDALVDELFQLGEAIEGSRADLVVYGKPKHDCMWLSVTSEVNNLGLNPVVTTTSSSSSKLVATDLTLWTDVSTSRGKEPNLRTVHVFLLLKRIVRSRSGVGGE